ncbi:MAG: carbohydrate porin, partial [Syntrophobacteraceae bacterium]|nr:carbohydrate porin [Syntrophobacteraceae bacterium]NSW87588.1 carbohydrate porin [Syntrophobacteraceae bacterium]
DRLHRDTEVHLEAYYRILIREYFAISPDIQYVANPVGNSRNDPIVAGMIRVELFY